MQLTISGHHLELTAALREQVTRKITRLERRHEQITRAHVILAVDKLQQKAEARLHVAGADIFADAHAEDMYQAIDLLADKLDRQLTRHKEKQRRH
ncbi:MAG: ribosome-associated translation inhibitor RaiA [Cellvibrionales bacterium]|nr:ribosome-associated translation inhibitor RaiA [Cellvibrionales bacterium]